MENINCGLEKIEYLAPKLSLPTLRFLLLQIYPSLQINNGNQTFVHAEDAKYPFSMYCVFKAHMVYTIFVNEYKNLMGSFYLKTTLNMTKIYDCLLDV